MWAHLTEKAGWERKVTQVRRLHRERLADSEERGSGYLEHCAGCRDGGGSDGVT